MAGLLEIYLNLKLIQSDRISEVENIEEASNTVLEYLTLQDIKNLFVKFDIQFPNSASLAQA